ncbi:MAG: Sensor protein ZraS [Candidatus Heimdallarchaeota archaeon LC_2]|nr:MAG: Sensor protein ZraS [Candidatus Heimdallarchaeota archaeon LC_2]
MEENNSPKNGKSYLCISIKDNGSGILEEYKNKIFEPFFTTKSDGFGIGLSSSYDQILEMGGLMDFSSKSNEGSIFNIYLPITSQYSDAELHHHQGTKLYSGTILVVDDEEQIRLLMKQNLEEKGFNVITAENGLLAYEILENESEKISGVLTDIRMP